MWITGSPNEAPALVVPNALTHQQIFRFRHPKPPRDISCGVGAVSRDHDHLGMIIFNEDHYV